MSHSDADCGTLTAHPPITAELRNAVKRHNGLGEFLVGEIHGDTLMRFPEGHEVRTARIVNIHPGDVFETRSGSVYRVTSWWRGAGSPRWDVV